MDCATSGSLIMNVKRVRRSPSDLHGIADSHLLITPKNSVLHIEPAYHNRMRVDGQDQMGYLFRQLRHWEIDVSCQWPLMVHSR
jgi:hypothetical protein